MPLLVTDFTWTQTDSTVWINVPLKGVKVGKVSIVSTDEYLKVNYPPYLFEAFLFEPVDDSRSSAKVGNGVVVFSLPKKSNNIWENLMKTTSGKGKSEIRDRALLKYQEKLTSESTATAKKQHAEKKYALETMMKLEQEKRDNIQKMKDEEREKTTEELASWQLRQRQEEEQQRRINIQNQKDKNKVKVVTEEKEKGRSDREKVKLGGKKKDVALPAPRSRGNIQVTFTPRVFPTALRESRVPEEEEWLKKQAEARHAANADLEDLSDLKEEERNPDWLKDKGDRCFVTGDYLAAVNCYSLAIRINRKLPALYSNRAACHLKLKNLHKAIEDCSQALDLLTPPVPANAAARARASVRRGSAFCQLQLYAEGLQDFQAALRLDPHNQELKADAQRIKDIIQGTADDPENHNI